MTHSVPNEPPRLASLAFLIGEIRLALRFASRASEDSVQFLDSVHSGTVQFLASVHSVTVHSVTGQVCVGIWWLRRSIW